MTEKKSERLALKPRSKKNMTEGTIRLLKMVQPLMGDGLAYSAWSYWSAEEKGNVLAEVNETIERLQEYRRELVTEMGAGAEDAHPTTDDETDNGELVALRSRVNEVEDQCRLERAKRIEFAALVGQFIERAVPLVNDTGISLDPAELARPLAKPTPGQG